MKEREENLTTSTPSHQQESTLSAEGGPASGREGNAGRSTSIKKMMKGFSSPRFFFDKHRFTYTFLLDGEVGSIHFDTQRAEIFYKGHNIRNMNLSETQINFLKQTVSLIAEMGQLSLSEHYRACLSKVINS